MDVKNITMEQLLEFAKRIYSDACFGHLDLLENYCQKNCEDFFNSLKSTNPLVIDSVSKFENFISTNSIYDANITITTNTSDII